MWLLPSLFAMEGTLLQKWLTREPLEHRLVLHLLRSELPTSNHPLSDCPALVSISILGSNLLWMLPWAIVVTKVTFSQADAWTYYSVIFGGVLVFAFINVALVLLLWTWRLTRGKIKVQTV